MFCSYCMNEIDQTNSVCPYCKNSTNVTVPPHRLVPGTVLVNRYVVGVAKGEGGFGITYIGRDTKLDRVVAIKEYYPSGLVNRNSSASPMVTQTQNEQGADAFIKGRERFLTEAKTLARFSGEMGIVHIIDFFDANNTAYIVMEYLDGISLKDYLSRNGVQTPEQTLTILMPVMLSLEKVHKQGLIHRDISPSNIMILKNTVKLIDFGAARNASTNVNKSLSLMLKPGYAPEEQYRSKGVQGPWTDVYALCATIYKCITGVTPDESNDRLHNDELKKPSELGVNVTPSFEAALMKGLSVLQQDRYQSIEALVKDLSSIAVSGQNNLAQPQLAANDEKPSGVPQSVPGDDDTRCIDSAERAQLNNAGRTPVQPQWNAPQPVQPAAQQYAGPMNNPVYPNMQNMQPMQQSMPASNSSDLDRKAAERIRKRKQKNALITTVIILAVIVVIVIVILAVTGKKDSPAPSSSSGTMTDGGKVTLTTGTQMVVTDTNGGRKRISDNYASYSNTAVTPQDIQEAKNAGVKSMYFTKCQIPQQTIDSLKLLDGTLSYLSIEECAGFTAIKSLSEIKSLKSLLIQKCDLSNESVNELDLSTMSGLYRLELLGVPKLSSIGFVSKANPTLTSICIGYCEVSDISAVSKLDKLYTFKAENCKITDISALKDKQISSISLASNKISDLSPLKGNKSLSSLDVSNNEIRSIEPLADCGDLKSINLNHNKLKDLKGMEKLIRLEKLECSDNEITDIGGIVNCTVLKYVNISSNKISDISLLSKNSETLTAAFIDNNQISDLSALSKAASLKCLSFNNNKITSLDQIKNCTKLTAISGDNNGISSLEPISAMSSLSCISFAHNKISDMKPVEKLTASMKDSMYVLDLSNNNISQITLTSGKKYQSVLMYSNPITNLDNVKQISGMTIAISYFEGIDLKEIKKGYYKLSIVDCPLDKQVAIEKEVGRYSVTFVTAEEIEKDTNSKKEAVFSRINS